MSKAFNKGKSEGKKAGMEKAQEMNKARVGRVFFAALPVAMFSDRLPTWRAIEALPALNAATYIGLASGAIGAMWPTKTASNRKTRERFIDGAAALLLGRALRHTPVLGNKLVEAGNRLAGGLSGTPNLPNNGANTSPGAPAPAESPTVPLPRQDDPGSNPTPAGGTLEEQVRPAIPFVSGTNSGSKSAIPQLAVV